MNYTFGNIRVGASVQSSGLAIAAYGIINAPEEPSEPPPSATGIPLQAPLVVSSRQQYAAIVRYGDTEDATSYDTRWSFDQINWTEAKNVSEIHEVIFPASTAPNRNIYAQHRAMKLTPPATSPVPLGDWTATSHNSIKPSSPVQIIVHPRTKRWAIGDRFQDYVSPEGLTISQMLDRSNFTVAPGYTITKIELVNSPANVGDVTSLTQRAQAHDMMQYIIRATYKNDATGKELPVDFEPMVRMVAVDVWLDVRTTQGTDLINIPATVPGTMVLSDFKHTINGTTYTTTGVTVAQLRAGPVPVTGAAGVTIANVGAEQWATLGVTAGAELRTEMGRQMVWVPTYGSNPGPKAKIRLHRGTQQLAGEGIAATVDLWGFDTRKNWRELWDEPMHTLGIKWTVPGRNQTTPLHMRAPWRDGTVAFGPFPTFVVRNPGSFTVSVAVSERSSGKYATDSLTDATGNPATAFPGAATIVVAPDGNLTGAPAGATVVATWAAAVAAVRANRVTKKQILFSSHVEHTVNDTVFIGSGWPNCYIGSYGPGRAVLNRTVKGATFKVFPTSLDQNGAIIRNLSFIGLWDPTTETGLADTVGISFEAGGAMTISDCDAEGMGTGFGCRDQSDTTPSIYIVSECECRGFWDYALYVGVGQLCRTGIIGNSLMQNPNAMMGGLGKSSTNPANKHFVRFEGGMTSYIRGNYLFARGGWSPPQGDYKQPGDQNPRDHTNHPRSLSYATENVFDGGGQMISGGAASPDQTGAGGYEHARNRVVENNLFVMNARSSSALSNTSCTTSRNNLIIKPRVRSNVWSATQRSFKHAANIGGVRGDTHIEAAKERIHIHHNTLVHLGDPVTDPGSAPVFLQNLGPHVRVVETDNIIHSPNYPAWNQTAAAPMVAVDEGLVSEMLGYKWRWEELPNFPAQLTMRTEFATPADTIRLWRPGSTSPAKTMTGTLKPPFDFDGNLTPGMPNGVGTTVPGTMWAGAVKPAA